MFHVFWTKNIGPTDILVEKQSFENVVYRLRNIWTKDRTWNTSLRGRLSTVDLPTELAFLIKMLKTFVNEEQQ